MVALAERDALPDEVICEFRSEHFRRQSRLHFLGEDGEGGEDAGGDEDGVANRFDVVEEGLDGFLEVFVVRCRKAFDGAVDRKSVV